MRAVSRGLVAGAVLALLLVPSISLAGQDQSTATVRVVVAPDGSPAGQAAVTVELVADPAVTRSASADRARPAEIRVLPPGLYRVVVSRETGAAEAVEVRIDPGETITLTATFATAGRRSEIRVTDRSHAGDAVVIGDATINTMPASGNLWSAIDGFVPWTLVDVIDNGGLGTGRRGLFGVRDASWTWNTFVMDGVSLTDPDQTGLPLQYPDLRAMEAVTVTSSLAPAEVSAPGAQVTLVPKRPGSQLHGSFDIAGTTDGMVTERPLAIAPFVSRIQSFRDLGGQVGGPIGKRVGLFVAGRMTRADTIDRGRPTSRSADLRSLFAHLVARPTSRDEVRAIWSMQDVTRPLEGGDLFLAKDVDELSRYRHAQVHWDRIAANGIISALTLGLGRGTFTPDVGSVTGGGVVDRVYNGAVPLPVARRTSRRLDIGADVTLPTRAVGRTWHAVRGSLTIRNTNATSHILASPDVGEYVGGIPARIWQFVTPAVDSERRATEATGAISDEMRLGEHVTLDASVRFSRWHGYAVGATEGLDAFTLAPRLTGRASFPGKGVAIFGAIGRYHPDLPLQWLTVGDPGQAWARLYRWTDPNGDRAFDASERGPQLALAGWGGPLGSIDPNLRVPTTTEYVFGGDYRHGSALFGATATIRHERSLVRAVDVGIPASSYTRTLIPDQTDDGLMIPLYERPANSADLDRFLLTNPANDVLKFHALEIRWQQQLNRRFHMRASALEWWAFGPGGAPGFHATENDQGLMGELFRDPNTSSHENGATFFDRSYVLKWSGTYEAPRNFWFTYSANYRDGQPFAGLIVVPNLTQGPTIVQSYRRGRTRFTFTVLFDMRVEKRFVVAGRQAALWLDMFNLANLYEEVEEDPVPSPGFRRSTALQPPRTLRAGFRIGF